MNADQILAANARTLFGSEPDKVSKLYKAFATKWHPDHCKDPKANDVFAHLTAMKAAALLRMSKTTQEVVFERKVGKPIKMQYYVKREVPTGQLYVTESAVVFVISDALSPLLKELPALKFADDKMKTEMERNLPNLVKDEEIVGGRLLAYRRNPDQVLLSDLIGHAGPINYKHVMWMVSRLLNISAYFHFCGFALGDFDPNTLLVSPKSHTIAIVGPMLTATPFNQRPKTLPSRTLEIIPRLAIKGEVVDTKTDLQLFRATAITALGATGARLLNQPGMNKTFASWLLTPPGKNALADFESWERARGPRSFTEYPVDIRDIY